MIKVIITDLQPQTKKVERLHALAINVNDQASLIRAGIHPPYVNIDRKVFMKTKEEKELLKLAKAGKR